MRSSSPLMSYRQVLETRQRGLTELEVSALLHQLLVELAKSHAIGQTHGDLSLESLWRDVSGDLYMNPPLGITTQSSPKSSPRTDVMAIANLAIELLTNHPPTSHWQQHCSIHPALAEILEQARSDFSTNAPQNASQLLQALYAYNHPQTPEPPPEPKTRFNTMSLVTGTGKWVRRILQSVLLLGVLMVAGWSAYQHFSALVFEKLSPADRSRQSPASPESSVSPSPQPSASQTQKPNRGIVIPQKTEDPEDPEG
jgi:hypothetical protein